MKFTIACLVILCSFSAIAQSKKDLAAEVAKLKTEIEQLKKPVETDLSTIDKKAGYGIGVLIASNIKSQGGDSLDVEAMKAGIADVYLGHTLKLPREEAAGIVQDYMMKAIEKKKAKVKDDNGAWLASNKTKEGVVTTASGLQYKIIKSGTGKTPSATDQVTVHYQGSTIDGNEFESSVKAGKPATFAVNGVITGWTEILQLMHEGDKWMVYIPYELGYGERGNGSSIPPFSTLIFELELLKVN